MDPGSIHLRALDGLALIDVEAALGDSVGLPVFVENDGNAAAVGESLAGVGRSLRSFLYCFFVEGFGGDVVIDGVPWRGVHGNAGEIGGMLPRDRYPSPTLGALKKRLEAHDKQFASLDAMLASFDPLSPGVSE